MLGALAAGALAYKNPKTVKNLLTGGAYGNTQDINATAAQLEQNRLQGQQQRLSNLGTMQAPVISDATQARIAALKQDAQAVPLSQNAYFQGDRANVVQNARQEIGGLANRQGAYGLRGGFSSIQGGGGGSIQDQYDRLSGQLAGLGQQARTRQDTAGQQAQTLEQEQADKQIEFQNQQALYRDAIYKGDTDAASQALQTMLQLKTSSRTAGYGAITSLVGNIGGSALRGSAGV